MPNQRKQRRQQQAGKQQKQRNPVKNKQANKANPKKGPNKGPKNKGRQNAVPKMPSVFEPNRPLTKDSLRNAVKQAVNFQLNPTMRMQNRAMQELTKQRELELRGQSRLGVQATNNIGTYYKDLASKEATRLAEQKAAGAAHTGAVAQAGVDALGAIQGAGNAAQTGIGAYEGQGIAARDRLAAMIAEQQAGAAQNANALNAQAQGQAAGFQNFLTGLSAASGMRGGEQISDVQRQVQNRFTDTRNEYGQELGKIRADKLELIMQRPELANKVLMELRDKEQTNSLSRAALGIKKKEASTKDRSGVEYAKVNARELMRVKKLEHRQRLQELSAAGASNQELAEIKAQQSKEIIELQQQGYGGGGGKGGGSGAGGWQPFSKTFSYLRGSPVKPKTLATSKKARKAAYDKLRTYGASDKVARKAIKKYIKQYKKQNTKKAITDVLSPF
jgi:hypothetical protein